MYIYELPNYDIEGRVDYVEDRDKAMAQNDFSLLTSRWSFLFEVGDSGCTEDILSGNFDTAEVIRLMAHEMQTKDGAIIDLVDGGNKTARIAMELLCPEAIVAAMVMAAQYGVPEITALHQLYCNDPNHTHCF